MFLLACVCAPGCQEFPIPSHTRACFELEKHCAFVKNVEWEVNYSSIALQITSSAVYVHGVVIHTQIYIVRI